MQEGAGLSRYGSWVDSQDDCREDAIASGCCSVAHILLRVTLTLWLAVRLGL